MSRYTGPKLRLIRKFGRLHAVTRKEVEFVRPGQHGGRKRREESTEYGLRLKEKQKIRFYYGITERQLVNYVKKSKRIEGKTGHILLQFLEMRLDNIVYRLGLAPTIFSARQLVNHRHICINGKRVSIPSYQCRPGDELSIWASQCSRSPKKTKKIISRIRSSLRLDIPGSGVRKGRGRVGGGGRVPQRVIRFDQRALVGNIISIISRDLVGLEVEELAVLEFYSRKI